MISDKKRKRLEFRTVVFSRDNNKCKFCDRTDNLDAHHITDRKEFENGGYVLENGITLCPRHHEEAEHFHATNGDDWYEGMHPDDLYDLIGSTLDRALYADMRNKR